MAKAEIPVLGCELRVVMQGFGVAPLRLRIRIQVQGVGLSVRFRAVWGW